MPELVLCQSRFTIAFVVKGLLVIKYRSKFVEFIGFYAHSIDTDNCVRVSFFLPFTLCRPNLSLQFGNMHQPKQNTYIFKFFQIEMGQMIAHQSFPFTLPISYASCNEQITSDRFNWFLFIFSHVLFPFNTIPLLTIQFILIFNIKFNRFIHAYASFTWYHLVYVERCDISVAINCTLNRCYQTKFLFRSPNVMKRQPTSSVVHSQCYTE